MTELNKEAFDKLKESENLIVLDFWAEWCGPCKMYGPIFNTVSEQNENVSFGKVNIDVESDLSTEFKIRSIPTTLFIKNGIVLEQKTGAMPAAKLQEVIDNLI